MADTGTFGVVTPQAETRAMVRAALAGLDPVDREISELHLRHGFYGADLADILGVPRGQAHTLASRARSRFEKSLGVLVLARSAREHCRELAAILDDHGGKPSPVLRWRVRRHFRRCDVCGVRKRGGLNPAILLELLPTVPLPAGLRHQTLRLTADRSPSAAAHRADVTSRAARLREDGFPVQLTTLPAPGWRITWVVAIAAAIAALALLAGAMYYAGHLFGHAAPAVRGQRLPMAGPAGPGDPARASAGSPARRPVAAPGFLPLMPGSAASAPSSLFRLAGSSVLRPSVSGRPASSGAAPAPSRSPSGSPTPATSPSSSPSSSRSSRPPSSPPASSPPPSSPPASAPAATSPAASSPAASSPASVTSSSSAGTAA
jgi:hypothetical protein